jgi:hypothetical protein
MYHVSPSVNCWKDKKCLAFESHHRNAGKLSSVYTGLATPKASIIQSLLRRTALGLLHIIAAADEYISGVMAAA